ncbi:hypothetical protein ACPV36_05100 [Photobacterium damselae]|uniref:hypothetical protein n=1 Tax=Photobacterium damselae TaxID=38293 RepID=UPI004068E244
MNKKEIKNDRNGDREIEQSSMGGRIKMLIGKRSIREAARDWNVNTSSLMNYLYKGSMPAADIANKIAKNEGVSIDWILNGLDKDIVQIEGDSTVEQPTLNIQSQESQEADMILGALPSSDRQQIAKRIREDGISSVLLDRKALQVAKMISDLPEESLKEILLLVNRAQYCALVGIPFHVTDQDITNCKKRA